MSNAILDYVGLDLDNIDTSLIFYKPFYKLGATSESNNEYYVYKKLKIKDIVILITDKDRTASIAEKYKTAKPLNKYIKENQESFVDLSNNITNQDIEEIDKMQYRFMQKIPYFIKYDKNYLWQIYYSKEDEKYFMLFPTKDPESAVLFYLIKKKIEKSDEEIFVPISLEKVNSDFLEAPEMDNIEKYLKSFTSYWPKTLQVSDGEKEIIYIIGDTKVYNSFKSKYRIVLSDKDIATNYYTLLKALFILATEAGYRDSIEPFVTENGELAFRINGKEVTIDNLSDFITEEVRNKNEIKSQEFKEIRKREKELANIKQDLTNLNDTYVGLEKQIVLFLDCRKSFFKKVKYYFFGTSKINKKFKVAKTNTAKVKEIDQEIKETQINDIEDKESYTIADLVKICSSETIIHNQIKSIKLDIKTLQTKKINYEKKIENAQKYIKEIDKHKKSIFDFWKFANKDELTALKEGTAEEKSKKLNKTFDLEEDLVEFKNTADSIQRQRLTEEEQDVIFVIYYLLDSVNAIISEKKDSKNKEKYEKIIFDQYKKLLDSYNPDLITNIIGEVDEFEKARKLNDKSHRENKRSIYTILNLKKYDTINNYKEKLSKFIDSMSNVMKKIFSIADMQIYYYRKNDNDGYGISCVNLSNLLYLKDTITGELLFDNSSVPTFYKMNLTNQKNLVYMSNIIFYYNLNKTLPVGMDESDELLVKVEEIKNPKRVICNILTESKDYDAEIREIELVEDEKEEVVEEDEE